jgi:NAD(P)-dependent dehydrogenase (short-subunit alcohol dehydrogenase family)
MARVWLITGASRGLGRVWTEAALRNGDRVVAISRSMMAGEKLTEWGDRVLRVELDVRDRPGAVVAVDRAVARFGRLDVVVNNAGFGLFGMIEEIPEPLAREQLDTNVLGPLWITQAALPHMRRQGSGHIIQISSIGGVVAFPGLGLYHASKWALEGFTESLRAEVAGFGIRVTVVEPGGFDTDWRGSSAMHAESLAVYDTLREQRNARSHNPSSIADPQSVASALLSLVDYEDPPARLLLGNGLLEAVIANYSARIEDWRRGVRVAGT